MSKVIIEKANGETVEGEWVEVTDWSSLRSGDYLNLHRIHDNGFAEIVRCVLKYTGLGTISTDDNEYLPSEDWTVQRFEESLKTEPGEYYLTWDNKLLYHSLDYGLMVGGSWGKYNNSPSNIKKKLVKEDI